MHVEARTSFTRRAFVALVAGALAACGSSPKDGGGSCADACTASQVCIASACVEPPVAALACPLGGPLGSSLTFDGSGSTDADGTIATWSFDVGGASPISGASPSIATSFAVPGDRNVTLTVTDDKGATGTASCTVTISEASAPVVAITDPIADSRPTQGQALGVAVSAAAAGGRTLASVELLVDGVVVGTDVAAPYSFGWTVPSGAATGATYTLAARATDDQGDVGFAPARVLSVRNDPPIAAFGATVTGATTTTISVDATASTDREADGALEVCWDWNADGTCDTGWSLARTASHDYLSDGDKTIGVRVRDPAGQVAVATRSVALSNVVYVAGEVTTTTWSGTVVVTGDVHVAAGETLTIAAGTTVQVVEVDGNADGVGDYGLDVDGTLHVQGTAVAPVLFTSVPASGAAGARDWAGVRIKAGATLTVLNHAVIEHADVALTVNAAAALEAIELRSSGVGLVLDGSGWQAQLLGLTVRDNAGDGFVARGASFAGSQIVAVGNGGSGIVASGAASGTVLGCTVARNASHGIELTSSYLAADECVVEENGKVGVLYRRTATGPLTHSQIRLNGEEGLRLLGEAGANPTPNITKNNVWGNASRGSLVFESISINATSNFGGLGGVQSALWNAPAGSTVHFVRASYAEIDGGGAVSGSVDSGTGTVLKSFFTSTPEAWWDVSFTPVSSLRARVNDATITGSGSTILTGVAYFDPAARRQVTALIDGGGVVQAPANFLGAWPDVAAVVTHTGRAQLQIGGFVGAPFDDTWVTGPYHGGETISEAVTWDSDVWITGNVSIAAGGSLTIPAGVRVTFVPTDLDGGGVGDWGLYRGDGDLIVAGTAERPVLFTALAPVPPGGGYQGIRGGQAGTTTMAHARIERGYYGVYTTGGSHALTDVTIADSAWIGLHATAGGITWSGGGVTGSLSSGIRLYSTIGSSFDHLALIGNGGWGADFDRVAGTPRVVLRDSVLAGNGAGGVRIASSAADVTANAVTGNSMGIRIEGSADALVTLNDVTGSLQEGVFVIAGPSGSPTATLTSNNVHGNATAEGVWAETVSLVASSPLAATGTVASSAWTALGDARIVAVRFEHEESESAPGTIAGRLERGDGYFLASIEVPQASSWWEATNPGPTSVRAAVLDNSALSSGTTSITRIVARGQSTSPVRPVELAAVIDSGVVDARGNYWGTLVGVPERIVQGDPGCVDFTGFVGTPIAGTGPQ